MHHVTGIFDSAEAAEHAVHELIHARFNSDDISILVTDREGTHEEAVEHDTGVAEGAVAGVAFGGLLGALGGALVATGVIVSPGLALLATGPIVGALKGAVLGAGAGLEIGALAGLGYWTDDAHVHAEALKRDGVVVVIPADHERADEAKKIFREFGADAVHG